MSAEINRHGLSRDIRDPVQRKVRQECGFGCIICGLAFYHYDHIDPPFEDAGFHDPAGIGLLCGTHHHLVTHNIMHRDEVREARKNPYCLRQGFTHWDAALGQEFPTIQFGESKFLAPQCALRLFRENVLVIRPPEQKGSPVRVSARFFDSSGKETLTIIDNKITSPVSNWDIETHGRKDIGGNAIIRHGKGDIVLDLAIKPRECIFVNRLKMEYLNVQIDIDDKGTRIRRSGSKDIAANFKGCIMGAECCVDVDDENRNINYVDLGIGLVVRGNNVFSNNIIYGASYASGIMFQDGLCITIGKGSNWSEIDYLSR